MTILHLALASDWEAAKASGSYRVSTRGFSVDEVGFIHCSTPAQVDGVAARFYADVTDPLTLLVMDEETVRASGTAVRFEDAGNGDLYPHVFGAIDPAWVIEERPAAIVGGALAVS